MCTKAPDLSLGVWWWLSCHALRLFSITCPQILLWKSPFFHYRTVMFCQTSLSKPPHVQLSGLHGWVFCGSLFHTQWNQHPWENCSVPVGTLLLLSSITALLHWAQATLSHTVKTFCPKRSIYHVPGLGRLSVVCTSAQLLTSRTLNATVCLELLCSACPHLFWQCSSLITICLEEHSLKWNKILVYFTQSIFIIQHFTVALLSHHSSTLGIETIRRLLVHDCLRLSIRHTWK